MFEERVCFPEERLLKNHKTTTPNEIIDSDKGDQQMQGRLMRGC